LYTLGRDGVIDSGTFQANERCGPAIGLAFGRVIRLCDTTQTGFSGTLP
jgi:hypothetical protein